MEEENENNFSIYKRNNTIIIKNNKSMNVNYFCLEINALDFTLFLEEEKDIEMLGEKLIDCIGIIGIISLEDDNYLIVITKAELICSITKKEIYKVLDTSFIKFSDDLIQEGDIFCNEDTKEKNDSNNNSYDLETNNDNELIEQLKEIFKKGFYFSNKYDLANSLTSQNQIICFFKKSKKLISSYDYIADGNKNFLSNWKLTDKAMNLEEKNKIKYYFSNCIYGNIEQFKFEEEKLQIILISRRFLWNYGIFNYRRGLSKYGGNSNQIETELILIHDNKEIYSNIHISSFIPIYFKNKKNIDMNDANKAFIKYFQNLIDEYNALFLFIIKNKDEEDKYINKLKNMLSKNMKSMSNKWKYYYINNKQKSIKNKIDTIKGEKNIIEFIGYNKLKDTQYDNEKNQIGIISLLSVDDHALNQNQFILVYEIIYHILLYMYKDNKDEFFLDKDINIKLDDDEIDTHYNEIFKKYKTNEFTEKVELFEKSSNLKINENQKYSSKITNNKCWKFIQNLKKIFKNRKKELSQQYYVNLDDESCKKYQRAYEVLFGKNMKYSPLNDYLNNLKEEFCDLENIKIYVGTWNTASTEFNKIKDINLDLWLIPKDPNLVPDIYFIGFQEVVELKASNVIMINEEKQQQILDEWDKKINESIQKVGKYEKLVEMNLVGINFYFYILEEKVDKVKNISKKIIKTGLGGATGNKGSCCINFEYENTNFSIACSHLAAGNKNKQRLKELDYILNLKLNEFFNPEIYEDKSNEVMNQSLEDIMPSEDENKIVTNMANNINTKKIYQKSNSIGGENNSLIGNESKLFKDSDIWIFFGDLNFRVDMEYEEFSQYMKNKNWNKLLDYDQFIKFQLASIDSMANIKEDEIKFQPTYKYIIDSNEFDYTPENSASNQNQNENLKKSGKKRNPSWCDRIFYKKNSYMTKDGKKIINGIEYNSVMDENFQTSDHRPIYQIFDVITFKENKDKKALIEKEIISNINLGISNKYMKKKIYDY